MFENICDDQKGKNLFFLAKPLISFDHLPTAPATNMIQIFTNHVKLFVAEFKAEKQLELGAKSGESKLIVSGNLLVFWTRLVVC